MRPFQVARFGVYAAAGLAAGSMLLSHNAGTPLDVALLRGVLVFVIFTAMAFGAEAVIHSAPAQTRPASPGPVPSAAPKADAPEAPSESVEDESE